MAFRFALFVAILILSLSVHSAIGQGVQSPISTTKSADPTVAQKIATTKDLLDINTAMPDQLNALPGMGNAYTQRLIAGRPYTAKNQLTTRGVIPQAAYEKIKDRIIAHRPKG
jgi:competence protein ComEA